MTKEEKKDEMKNRISMALKDPILQQGFEIICKNLAELKTENNKLLDVINNQDVKIADLEKNYKDSLVACGVLKKKVELLAQPSPLESMQDTLITTQKVAYEKQNEQLTKAKEILKMIVNYYPCYNKTITEQAEQFLRETDIDNAIQKANEGLDLDKIADEVEQDLNEGCPDILCEDCTKEDCTVRKLGLVEK